MNNIFVFPSSAPGGSHGSWGHQCHTGLALSPTRLPLLGTAEVASKLFFHMVNYRGIVHGFLSQRGRAEGTLECRAAGVARQTWTPSCATYHREPALAGGLDWRISRGPFWALCSCDSLSANMSKLGGVPLWAVLQHRRNPTRKAFLK